MTARERAIRRGGAGWINAVGKANVAEAKASPRHRRPTLVLAYKPAMPISWWQLTRKQRDEREGT